MTPSDVGNALVIEPGVAERHYWRDIWRYRELFYVLAWRDLAVRYKQTAVGLVWALLQPLVTMAAFTIVFGKLAKMPAEGNAPYALLVLAGLLPWQFFATSLSAASNSLIGNANLISKVYFPRMIIPAAAVVVSFADFLISFLILIATMAWYRFPVGWQILALPAFVLMTFVWALGLGVWMAALNVKYRDVRYVIPFVLQVGLYVSPVGFSSAVVSEQWRLVYSLNPMVGIIDGFRWAILGGAASIDMRATLLGLTVSALALWIGIRRFRATEKYFADLI